MSYTINRGGKDYTFDNQAKYEEFYNQVKETAKRHGVSTADVFRTQYPLYTDSAVEVPSTVTNVAPANASAVGIQPNYTNQQSVNTSVGGDTYGALYANAEAYKNNMYSRANNLRNASYAEATRAREEAERLAEVQRKRGVVDSSTMAAQQRATYGANAEALGRSGLNVSGYSDYLNSQAYATGMAYRQAANAQATEANRQASYQEALARLEADKINAQSKAEADKTYYGLLNEIESAKIADAQAKEQQKQTNYQEFLASIPDGATKDQVNAIAENYGITDEKEIGKAISYAEAMGLTINDGSPTDSTVNEDAVSKVFSHQEGEETVLNADYQIKDEYNKAKELHEKGDMDEATWRVIEGTYKMEYDNIENYVSVYSQTYDKNSFGKFASGDAQTKLLENIKGMVEGKVLTSKGEKLKKGDEIAVNVGSGTQKIYEYLGNGLFKETKYSRIKEDYVVPEGFVYKYSPQSNLGEIVETTGIIDVNEDSAVKKFGSFLGSGNKNSKQSKYINTIIEDAKQDKITKGQKVIVNFGETGRGTYVYEYIGNGKFINTGKSHVYLKDKEEVYEPEGYVARQRASNGSLGIYKE